MQVMQTQEAYIQAYCKAHWCSHSEIFPPHLRKVTTIFVFKGWVSRKDGISKFTTTTSYTVCMDPLSIIASVAGISQAGASLSKAIYKLISSTRGAPREIADIARGISELSVILSELRRVLRDGKSLYRRKLLRKICSAMRRIGKIQLAIGRLMDVGGGVGRLKWAFRRSTSTQLLYQIEAHKGAINMILHTMTLAVQIRVLSSFSEKKDEIASKPELELERDISRQQAENMVESSFQSLQQLTAASTPPQQDTDSEDDHANPSDASNNTQNQMVLWNGGPDDTAAWLYRTVFSSYADSLEMDDDDSKSDSQGDSDEEEARLPSSSLSLQLAGLGSAFKKPNGSQNIVNELLAEWTVLTNEEIDGVDAADSKARQAEPVAETKTEEPLHIKDAVGRKFMFPFHKANTWQSFSKLLNEAFAHVDIIGPHVLEGHYDNISAESGCCMLPSLWSDLIKPGDMYEMRMWPLAEPKPKVPPGLFPPGMARRPPPGPSPPPPPPPGIIPKFPASNPPVKSKSPEPQSSTSKPTKTKKKAAYVGDD